MMVIICNMVCSLLSDGQIFTLFKFSIFILPLDMFIIVNIIIAIISSASCDSWQCNIIISITCSVSHHQTFSHIMHPVIT